MWDCKFFNVDFIKLGVVIVEGGVVFLVDGLDDFGNCCDNLGVDGGVGVVVYDLFYFGEVFLVNFYVSFFF